MYVAPTPFGLTHGTAHNQTLILPKTTKVGTNFKQVGSLVRREAETLVIGYKFDLLKNNLTPKLIKNPHAGRKHFFIAWRLKSSVGETVSMRKNPVPIVEGAENENDEDLEA